jgi:hypothetical protein
VLRFALGGPTAVVAGIIADMYGPAVGGLFLAFPAFFCASATLIEKHERKRKQEHGLKGHRRGTDPAGFLTPPVLRSAVLVSQPLRWLSGCWPPVMVSLRF